MRILISMLMVIGWMVPLEAKQSNQGRNQFSIPSVSLPGHSKKPHRPIVRQPVEPCPATGCLTISGPQIYQQGVR